MKHLAKPYHEINDGSIRTFVLKESSEPEEPIVSIYKIRKKCPDTGDYILYNIMNAQTETVDFEDLCRSFKKVSEKNLNRIFQYLVQADEIYNQLSVSREWIKDQ